MNASGNDVLFGIVVRETDRLIGSIGLNQIDFRYRSASLGMMMGEKSMWGKGYGTEATRLVVRYAFEELHLNRVQLHVYEYNLRGMRVYEKSASGGKACCDRSMCTTAVSGIRSLWRSCVRNGGKGRLCLRPSRTKPKNPLRGGEV